MDKKNRLRTARRVVDESPRAQPTPQPAAPVVPIAAVVQAAADAADADARGKVRKLALIYADDEKSFNTERMERSTIERFKVAYRNTPELHDGDGADVDGVSIDVSGLIGKAYEVIFGSAAAFAVRARKLTPRQATAFTNRERIAKLIPRTEKTLDEKFGGKLRNLPPMAQLGIDIVATIGLMVQDAAQMPEDDAAPGAPHVAPGQEIRR